MYSIDNTTEAYINKANPNPLPISIIPSPDNMIPIRNGSIPNVTIDSDVFNIFFIICFGLNIFYNSTIINTKFPIYFNKIFP